MLLVSFGRIGKSLTSSARPTTHDVSKTLSQPMNNKSMRKNNLKENWLLTLIARVVDDAINLIGFFLIQCIVFLIKQNSWNQLTFNANHSFGIRRIYHRIYFPTMNTSNTHERRGSCSSTSSNNSMTLLTLPRQSSSWQQSKNQERPIIESQYMSSSWLASKLLRNSDVALPPDPVANALNDAIHNRLSLFVPHIINANHAQNNINLNGNGDICLFHYPTSYLPKLAVEQMAHAFELISEVGRIHDEQGQVDIQLFNEAQLEIERSTNMDIQGEFRNYVANASQRARDQIARIQFSWYQFEQFPREVVGRAYVNLRHVDIRQNDMSAV